MATNFLSMPHARRARERLILDVRSLARDAERLLEATADDLGDKAHEARERLADAIERVRATTDDWRERATDAAQDAARRADRTVRENPYRSMGVAFGVGVVLGWLLRRK
jgi:ElaB/YqjD/DUF883 family membrane-anchored ribosome-binding protein